MDNWLKRLLIGLAAAGGLAVLYGLYLETHEVQLARERQLAALLTVDEKVVFLAPEKSAGCQSKEPLPDSGCTPGAIFEDAVKEEICVPGYSKKVRNVSQKTKKKVFEMYGIEYPQPFGSYEVDHLIPLSLGGNNDLANLWPKVADPILGFWEKNIAANYLHKEVCQGQISLNAAQKQMAQDWTAIYKNIGPKRIEELRMKYPNWADRNLKKQEE